MVNGDKARLSTRLEKCTLVDQNANCLVDSGAQFDK